MIIILVIIIMNIRKLFNKKGLLRNWKKKLSNKIKNDQSTKKESPGLKTWEDRCTKPGTQTKKVDVKRLESSVHKTWKVWHTKHGKFYTQYLESSVQQNLKISVHMTRKVQCSRTKFGTQKRKINNAQNLESSVNKTWKKPAKFIRQNMEIRTH